MKKRIFIWGLALLTVMNIAALATLGYNRFSDDERDRRHASRMSLKERLGLSDEQAVQMEAMRKSLDERIKPLQSALREKRKQFFQLMMTEQADQTQIDAIQGELDSLQIEIRKHVIDNMLAQKAILTPEQQNQYFSRMQSRYNGTNGDSYRRR